MRQLVTSNDIGPEPSQAWISLDLLMIDHNYQRDAIPKHVQNILLNFNWRYFQPPTICPNKGKRYWVIDGQQRVLAAKLHPVVSKVPCYIIDTSLTKDQAAAFIHVNKNRRNVNPINMYWAGIVAKDEKYLALQRVLHSAGAEVSPALGVFAAKTTNAVGYALLSIKYCGEHNVGLAVQTICEAQPETPNTLTSNLIRALSVLFRDHEDLSKKIMVELLSHTNLELLSSGALATKKLIGGSTVKLLGAEIMKRYLSFKKRQAA